MEERWAGWGRDLDGDVRPLLLAAAREGRAVGLATIVAADGGPRPVGAQMAVSAAGRRGVLSGGCIDADVARHARAALADGEPRRLVYGSGSPFLDLALPCGRSLAVLVERVGPDDPALAALARLTRERRPALWRSDGRRRSCAPAGSEPAPAPSPAVAPDPWEARVACEPVLRLLAVGSDAFARAIAECGLGMGWEVTLVGAADPAAAPPGLRVMAGRPGPALAACAPDRWTAVAVALHDAEAEVEALVPALGSDAFYVGAMGSRSRLPQRQALLRAAGLGPAAVERLRAPIGLGLGGREPHEVALAVAAEVLRDRRRSSGRLAVPTVLHAAPAPRQGAARRRLAS